MNTNIRKPAILLFFLLMFCYSYVHQNLGWNQNSRLDLLRGLVLYGTFKIDADHENTGDKSVHNGHYYSDKAPGIAFLALPAFALSVTILHALDVPLDSPRAWLASSWITTVGSVGWITALGGVAMFVFLAKIVGQRYAYLSVLAVFLGSLPFPYATMLFSHAAVIGLLCIALWAIGDSVFFAKILPRLPAPCSALPAPHSPLPAPCSALPASSPWLKRHLLAGLCCGLAIASEYTAATAAGGVLALALLTGGKRGLVLALGAIPPLLLIPIYNWICFGGPLAFGYHHLALPQFQAMNQGLFGITFPPKPGAIYLILISPERGLFFWSPFFLMAFFGLKPLWQASRRLFWVSSVVVVLHVLAMAGYFMPGGGSALGPRHLAPMLPLEALMAAYGMMRWPRAGSYLGHLSIALTGVATLVDAMPSDNLQNPLINLHLSRLFDGEFAHHLGLSWGIPPFLSVFMIIAILLVPYWLLCFFPRKVAQLNQGVEMSEMKPRE